MPKPRIMIVEDDEAVADVVRYNLEQAHFDVTVIHNGLEAIHQASLSPPDLVILDLMLPLADGIEVCRRLRAEPQTASTRILMLTAKAEETDEIVGFSVGADDYVAKPFSVKVLIERVKALLRRGVDGESGEDIATCHGIAVDRARHRVVAGNRAVDMTRTEFALLDTIIRQPGRVFSRNELISAALGGDALVTDRTIDVHIRAVRNKLEDLAHLVETVRGVGYRFHDAASRDQETP